MWIDKITRLLSSLTTSLTGIALTSNEIDYILFTIGKEITLKEIICAIQS
jgi:hypothetical protein